MHSRSLRPDQSRLVSLGAQPISVGRRHAKLRCELGGAEVAVRVEWGLQGRYRLFEGAGSVEPLARRLSRLLKGLGVGPLSTTPFDAVVELADAYMQLTIPSFEFPRDI